MDHHLRAHFENTRQKAQQRCMDNLIGGLDTVLNNLTHYLENQDATAALAYLEDDVGINTLLSQKSGFPEAAKPGCLVLEKIYSALKSKECEPRALCQEIYAIQRNTSETSALFIAANDPS